MSANEKMVMVPRAPTREMLEAYERYSLAPIGPLSKSGYDAMLDAAPAQQGEGEPVAHSLLRRCLMAVREQHCDDGEAEFDLPASLLVDIDVFLSASANPAEIERLHKELGEVRAERDEIEGRSVDIQESLRAQLTQAQALLCDIKRCGLDAVTIGAPSIRERLDAALSASAEPSAPVEIDEQPEFVKTITAKLQRFLDCAEDGQGADIGREWFDVLTKLGLLRRIQRSPAWWEVTEQGDALLARAALDRKP